MLNQEAKRKNQALVRRQEGRGHSTLNGNYEGVLRVVLRVCVAAVEEKELFGSPKMPK